MRAEEFYQGSVEFAIGAACFFAINIVNACTNASIYLFIYHAIVSYNRYRYRPCALYTYMQPAGVFAQFELARGES